jgi:type IV pilus assembly protein PilQ
MYSEKLKSEKEKSNFPNPLESFKMLHFNTKVSGSLLLGIVLASIAALFTACASQNAANVKTAGETNLITDIVTSEDADSTVVTLKASQPLTYTAMKQVFPLGVLFHFPDTILDNIENVYYPPESNTISAIRATQVKKDGVTSRIFIALKSDRPYDVTPDEAGLRIYFPKAGTPIAEEAIQAERPKEAEVALTPESVKAESLPASRITSVSATPLKKNVVINVKADGEINNYKSFTIGNPPRIVFDMFGLKSPYQGEQRIAVKSKWVEKIRHFGYPDKIRMVLETNPADMSNFFASTVDNGLLVYVGSTPASVNRRESKVIATQVPPAHEPEPQNTSTGQATQTAAVEIKPAEPEAPVTLQAPPTPENEYPEVADDQQTLVAAVGVSGIELKKPVALQASPTPESEDLKASDDQTIPAADLETKAIETEEQMLVQTPAGTTPAQKKTTHDQAHNPMVSETQAPVIVAEATTVQAGKPAWLNRIDFSSEAAGKSAIIIGTTRPVEYRMSKINGRRLQLKLLHTNLPEYRKRALITTRFQSAVDRITPTQSWNQKDTIIDIELREAVAYVVKQTGDLITVNFSASSIPPKPYEDAKLPAWKRVLAEQDVGHSTVAARKADRSEKREKIERLSMRNLYSEGKRLEGSNIRGVKKYKGEPIVLDFYDTDIKNVFRIIKEISGKNFAIDKNVTGKVTLTLEKPVPWDQVLDLVLKMNGLGMKMEGDIIRITTLATIKKEEDLEKAKLAAAQKKMKQEDLVTAFLPINYASATEVANLHIKPLISPSRVKDGASVTVDSRLSMVILTDVPSVIRRAKEIIQRIDLVTPQVIIEARIVEANTNFTREVGFSWGDITVGPFDIGDTTVTLTGLANNLPATTTRGQIGGTFSKLTGTPFDIIDAKLAASETEGKTNIISAPKVVTLNNKKAKIKQGLEVPYLERDSSGNATVRFKNVDLLLEVTPNITPDDRIVMNIFVTKNDVVDPSADQPALSTNEAQTELLVDNGDTVVIGGIVKSTMQYAENGIPGLRKLGVLGWLFKSQEREDRKNELLIFITPQIVQLEQRNQI